jgi:hypothetical protein
MMFALLFLKHVRWCLIMTMKRACKWKEEKDWHKRKHAGVQQCLRNKFS